MCNDAEQNVGEKGASLLIKQLKMSELAWNALQNNGVNNDDEFCLNFQFTSPDRTSSETLKDFISQKTNYTVYMVSESWYRKNWIVQGLTEPIKISREMIDQWTSKMVKLGLQYNCRFDGWWIWKDGGRACPDVRGIRQSFGSIIESKPWLIKLLARMMTGKYSLKEMKSSHFGIKL